jgi:tetratricopeptide (TPR) repeat protein
MKSKFSVFLVLLLLSVPVMAQEAPAAPPNHQDDMARGLFDAGRAAYEAGSYRQALGLFQQAYEASQRPQLLYNIGQTADRLRMDRTAITTFRRYLELMPTAENRQEVENRIRALEELTAEDDEAPVEPTVAPTPSAPPVQAQRITVPKGHEESSAAPWLLVGTGAAIAVTGVVLFMVGTGQVNQVGENPRWSEVKGNAESGPRYQNVGLAAIALGTVGAAIGLVWLATGSEADTSVAVGPQGVTVRGSF